MTKVIGSQTDVPDIGDPIVSPWAQDTAKKIVHTFASTTARDAWADPPEGAFCEAPVGAFWYRLGGVWRLISAEVDSGYRSMSLPPIQGIGVYDMLDVSLGGHPRPVKTYVDLVVYAGFTSIDMVVGVDVVEFTTGNTVHQTSGTRVWAQGSNYYPVPLHVGWNVPPGQDMGFQVRFRLDGIAAQGGTLYVSGHTNYRVVLAG